MKLVRRFAIALGFLTRIPLRLGEIGQEELGRAVAFFPLVGLLIGLALAACAVLVHGRLPALLAAVLIVSFDAALTGGLHLDGVGDLFDAVGGGRGDRERMLAILRDPHIGAHGAVALVLVLALKIFATAELVEHAGWGLLVGAPVAARLGTVLLVGFPYARPEGVGKAFHGQARTIDRVAATMTALLCLGAARWRALAPACAAVLVSLLVALWLHRRLGGLTGDVHGAAIELASATFLATATVGL